MCCSPLQMGSWALRLSRQVSQSSLAAGGLHRVSLHIVAVSVSPTDPFLFFPSFFLEKNMFVFFLNILRQKSGRYVCVQLLQTLNILFENISHETSLCKDVLAICLCTAQCRVVSCVCPTHFILPRLYPNRLSGLDSKSMLPTVLEDG